MYLKFTLSFIFCFFFSSCKTQRQGVPAALEDEVELSGLPNARFWMRGWHEFDIEEQNLLSPKELSQKYPASYAKEHNYLAISGGGNKGAYGAGILCGWTKRGDRPEFTRVTGISTGAIISVFAYLGPSYDIQLKEIYTKYETKDIAREKHFFSLLGADSLMDTKPLERILASYITPHVVEEIAQQYRLGRRLHIGTVNLDAGRAVTWDIGRIASSSHPDKIEIICKIIMASSAIPMVFSPVSFEVEYNDQIFQELHVDGGTGSQVFVYPASADWSRYRNVMEVKGRPKVYVIRNGFSHPEYRIVQGDFIDYAERSISAWIVSQGLQDILNIYNLCQRDGNDFYWTHIPDSFEMKSKEFFDKIYMDALFKLGEKAILNQEKDIWKTKPIGL
ncbi:MAG: patatin-like phospholipase family protein [Lentisphaeria bacterium]|nr:patatin-like phospholipase family protein [Lentisphaeria bacterium]